WIIIGIVVVALAGKYGGTTSNDFAIPGTTSDKAQTLLAENAPGLGNASVNVVYEVQSGSVNDPASKAAIEGAIAALKGVPNVANVSNPFNPILAGNVDQQNFDNFLKAVGASPDVNASRIFPNSIAADGKTALVGVQMNKPATDLPADAFLKLQT